jgi:hypothetical protein
VSRRKSWGNDIRHYDLLCSLKRKQNGVDVFEMMAERNGEKKVPRLWGVCRLGHVCRFGESQPNNTFRQGDGYDEKNTQNTSGRREIFNFFLFSIDVSPMRIYRSRSIKDFHRSSHGTESYAHSATAHGGHTKRTFPARICFSFTLGAYSKGALPM